MFKVIASAALVAMVFTAPAQAGGVGDFYYGPKYTPRVLGFYGQATNYDSPSYSQTYHYAFKNIPSGYVPAYVQACNEKRYAPGYDGYFRFYSRAVDCRITFAIKKASNGTLAPATYIPYTAWR